MTQAENIDPILLAQALIRCASVTPEEGGALSLLEDLLQNAGFATNRLVFTEPGYPDISNLYARYGTRQPCLLFAGHTDVVPPGNKALWRHPPFAGTIEDGSLFGRGAVDMKGGVACMVACALDFVRNHPDFQGSIAFLLTGDEEGPAVNGTVKVLQWMRDQGERFDHCLLAEPTSVQNLGDSIKIGRRGSLTGSLTVQGIQGHVAYPDRAQNPIPPLMRLLEALINEPLDSGTAHFSASNLEIVSIETSTGADNVIPAQAKAIFNIRFNDLWSAETLQVHLSQRLEKASQGERYSLSFKPSNAAAFLTPPDNFTALVASAIESETGRKPVFSTAGGTSDARFIKDYGPVLEFGLVGQTMHKIDECAALDDLETLTRIFNKVLKSYFACR